RALAPLRQALRLARDSGAVERMASAVALATHVLHRRGWATEVATLVEAVEAVHVLFPRWLDPARGLLPHKWPPGVTQLVCNTGSTPPISQEAVKFDAHLVAGLQRAADLALRILDEELALVAAAGNETGKAVPATSDQQPATLILRCEGNVWSIEFGGTTHRVKDSRGLQYLALLFAHPGREFHAGEIVALSNAPAAS